MNDEQSKLVPFARPWRRTDPARAAEFAATARRLRVERETSAELVTRVLRETPRSQWRSLATRQELQSVGAIEQISKEMDRRLDNDPHEALSLAELATAIVAAMPFDAYPPVTLAQLRSHVWKDCGQALCYLSRYDDALAALETAEVALEPHGMLMHDKAIVWFVRATVLQHLRRFDEAQALLARCRSVFRGHQDRTLYAKCSLAQALLLIRRGNHETAKKILHPLVGNLDPSSNGLALLALGWCSIHGGRPVDAFSYFRKAVQTFDQLGHAVQSLRAAWGMGAALLRQGRLDAAVDQLTTVRALFLTRQLVEEAGLAGLELVEAQMLRGHHEDARVLAARIVGEFTEARMNHRAIAALGYLNDAVHASAATPEVVRSVHEYIVALRNDPTREYNVTN